MPATPHTPGPWTANSQRFIDDAHGLTIAHCPSYNGTHPTETQLANATLIAAAPDLLLALQIAANTLETVYRERDPKNIAAKCAAERARAAIAKAEGAAPEVTVSQTKTARVAPPLPEPSAASNQPKKR